MAETKAKRENGAAPSTGRGRLPSQPGRTVTCHASRDYGRLTVLELLAEIKECVGGLTIGRNETCKEIRDRLLPALLELRKKTYRKKPGFYESLAAIRLNANTVRVWFHRSHSADEVADMMEPERDEPEDETDEPNKTKTHLPGRDHQSPEDLLLLHCDRLVDALLAGKIVYAKKMGTEYKRIRDERPIDPVRGMGVSLEEIRRRQ